MRLQLDLLVQRQERGATLVIVAEEFLENALFIAAAIVGDGTVVKEKSLRNFIIGPTLIQEQNYTNSIRMFPVAFGTEGTFKLLLLILIEKLPHGEYSGRLVGVCEGPRLEKSFGTGIKQNRLKNPDFSITHYKGNSCVY